MRISTLLLAALTACNSIFEGNAPSSAVKLHWFTPFSSPGGWPGLPAVDAGLVVVAGIGGMAAYDAATGQPRWQAQIWNGGQASFAGNIVTGGGLACLADYFGVGCAELGTG